MTVAAAVAVMGGIFLKPKCLRCRAEYDKKRDSRDVVAVVG